MDKFFDEVTLILNKKTLTLFKVLNILQDPKHQHTSIIANNFKLILKSADYKCLY